MRKRFCAKQVVNEAGHVMTSISSEAPQSNPDRVCAFAAFLFAIDSQLTTCATKNSPPGGTISCFCAQRMSTHGGLLVRFLWWCVRHAADWLKCSTPGALILAFKGEERSVSARSSSSAASLIVLISQKPFPRTKQLVLALLLAETETLAKMSTFGRIFRVTTYVPPMQLLLQSVPY